MGFANPIAGGGGSLVRPALKSPDYVPGASGWTVNRDGTAEFAGLQLTVTGSSSGLTILRSSDGTVVGSIDENGVGSFQDVTVVDDISLAGTSLVGQLSAKPNGLVVYGKQNASSTPDPSESWLFQVSFVADASRLYRVSISGLVQSSNANDCVFLLCRDFGSATPTKAGVGSSTLVMQAAGGALKAASSPDVVGSNAVITTFSSGQHNLIIGALRHSGAGNVSIYGDANNPVIIAVEDVGSGSINNVAVSNSGGGGTPVVTYTKTYACTWSASYDGSGNKNTFGGSSRAYQGSIGDSYGNRRSLLGFDYATIAADLAGSTINACKVTMYAQHWWFNSGGTAIIGTHNQAVGSAPATFGSNTTNRVQSAGWPNPGLRTVDLGTTIGANFRDGTAKGICLGPGPSSSQTYYGFLSGAGATNPPYLTITYTK